jgi:hypothetical protein
VRKASIALAFAVVMLLVYLIMDNIHSKQELEAVEFELENLIRFTQEPVEVHEPASDTAVQFIWSYLDYEGIQEKNRIVERVTKNVADQLALSDNPNKKLPVEGHDGVNKSDVKDLEIYYGSSSKDKQQLFAAFRNVIDTGDEISESMRFLKLSMVLEEGKWKVDHMEWEKEQVSNSST